jgi:hypothetical protein
MKVCASIRAESRDALMEAESSSTPQPQDWCCFCRATPRLQPHFLTLWCVIHTCSQSTFAIRTVERERDASNTRCTGRRYVTVGAWPLLFRPKNHIATPRLRAFPRPGPHFLPPQSIFSVFYCIILNAARLFQYFKSWLVGFIDFVCPPLAPLFSEILIDCTL